MRPDGRALASTATLILLLSGGCGGRVDSDRPNVVLFVVDTLRADSLGAYGHPEVRTPAFDRLAAEGTLFERAYAPSSWTRASMASLLSAVRPETHGAEGREDALPAELTLLSEHFQRSGYHTGLITANPNIGSFFGFDQGFDDFVELYARRDSGYVRAVELVTRGDEVAQAVEAWLAEAPRPSLLVVLSIDPHSPYQPPAEFDLYGGDYTGAADGSQESITRPDLSEADRARIRSLYLGEVSYSDRILERVLRALDDDAPAAGTVFALTSDHGEEFWEHGRRGHALALFEESIRVPLVIRYPGTVPAGARVDESVETIDLYPTLAALAGLPAPADVDGRALFPLADRERRPALASLRMGRADLAALRAGNWKLVWDRTGDRTLLFDLASDPAETRDLAASEPETTERLHGLLRDSLRQAADRGEQLRGAGTLVPLEELPEDQQRLLDALGYTEGSGED